MTTLKEKILEGVSEQKKSRFAHLSIIEHNDLNFPNRASIAITKKCGTNYSRTYYFDPESDNSFVIKQIQYDIEQL